MQRSREFFNFHLPFSSEHLQVRYISIISIEHFSPNSISLSLNQRKIWEKLYAVMWFEKKKIYKGANCWNNTWAVLYGV